MPDREKIIKGLEMCLADEYCNGCPYEENCFDPDIDNPLGSYVMRDALALLKEQDNEKKRIMKVIWDTLHEGLSIDTVADQDWVYEQIRHKIEGT